MNNRIRYLFKRAKSMKVKQIFFVVIIIISVLGCRKDSPVIFVSPPAYGEKYVGTYDMEVKRYNWMMGTPSTWSTFTTLGAVYIYDSTATYPGILNTFSPFENLNDKKNGLTIRIMSNQHTRCVLELNDTIRTIGGYHYHHDGYFKGDSLYFNITNLGGLGGGSSYYARGKKN